MTHTALALATLVIATGPFLAFPTQAGDTSSSRIVVKPVTTTSTTSSGDPINLPQRDAQIVVSTYEIPPGASLPIHKHPFPRYGYVLEGALQVTNEETGRTDVFKTGDFILEAVGRWHRGSSVSDMPTKLLVIDLVEKGSNNTVQREFP